MKPMPRDLRTQTLDLLGATRPAGAAEPVALLIAAWLAALDEADLDGSAPAVLAPLLWDGFAQAVRRAGGCQIAALRYPDGAGAASALLILNDDMPYLVDSIVMALRRGQLAVRGVMSAVLAVRRGADGVLAAPGGPDDPPESYVLCLLDEELAEAPLAALLDTLRMVARDAAVVRRDAAAMDARMGQVAAAAAARGGDGAEVAGFLEWAAREGFEPFGYAYYRARPGQRELERDLPSRIGVLQDGAHPVYAHCLARIPGDFDTLARRAAPLSVLKADVGGTLHREQQLDFIGVRDQAGAQILGEHCFVGLFTRAAATWPLASLPYTRGRVAEVLRLAGVGRHGFRAEKFREILDSLPRTEALEAEPDWLAQVCGAVVSLYKRPRTRVFARRDVYGRHLNVLVYLAREHYSASVAAALARALQASSGASHVSSHTLVADGPLARLYLTAHAARYPLDLTGDIEQPLLAVLGDWQAGFAALAGAEPRAELRAGLRKLGAALPPDYMAATAPPLAVRDLSLILARLDPARVAVRIEPGAPTTIRLYSVNRVPTLSGLLPALHNAGIAIERERCNAIVTADGARHFFSSLTVDPASAAKLARPRVAPVAQELFGALFNDEAEDGRLNGLVLEGALATREVQLVRAYMSYWRQAGCRFSVRYIADCLRREAGRVRALVDAFLRRFDPAAPASGRAAALDALAALKAGLAAVDHADSEEILAALADLIGATLRTSYFQDGQRGDRIVFKFDSAALALLPQPRPQREIYVFARRFEGVHLRGGPVARGGLRWSDRMEDYRTEVLGLVKAQMVKNAVIVPVGAKGGFVCKTLAQDAAREAVAAEGEAVYRLFVASLLDLTDNRVRGQIVAPPDTVCYDDPDPYLVVAADKGTASFSDIANGIAQERGFWLGDAFASGGSNGYDHKKLGITAKGAWEAVRRHFYEMEHDLDAQPVTLVGVGDMSGDVFGNGMLRSRQIKLLAAFDHRHIFLDPRPDPAVSFGERARLFALARSSWDDYDRALISEGGGVFARSARSIALSPQVRAALAIEESALPPEQLMRRILMAPVDLFYNGGIGTYIKAAGESHAQVKDRANDAIRVDGCQLRAKVVAEGGNLGATQAGRIEYALAGGRIFSDAIDNSAGVDCSDHEVNAKIWLDAEIGAGRLQRAERDRILAAMSADIEQLVLRDNQLQTHLLARELQGQDEGAAQDGYAALIGALEQDGALSRQLEQLPSEAELARRRAGGRGLCAPELALVVAHVKNRYKRLLAARPLLDADWAETLLTPYFPAALVAGRAPRAHPLANAILATVLANEAVNRCGPLMLRELALEHGVAEADVILAWGQAWSALHLGPVFEALDADALAVPRAVSVALDGHARALQKAMIEGVLSLPAGQLGRADGLDQLARLFGRPELVRQLLPAAAGADDAALPAPFALAWRTVRATEGMAAFLFAALTVARPDGMELAALLRLGLALRGRIGLDALERGLRQPPHSHSQGLLRNHAQRALLRTGQRLLAQALRHGADADADAAVAAVADALGLPAPAAAPDLEQAMLDVWALSEAAAAAERA